jgi:hypothetical protein
LSTNGNQDVQARQQRAVVLAQPLHHPGVLLRHDAHRLDHEGDHDAEQHQGDDGQAVRNECVHCRLVS